MGATTTAFNVLLTKLQVNFPAITFVAGEEFRWSPSSSAVFYVEGSADCTTLLHETAHAVLKHKDYTQDIELLGLERDAWSEAVGLAKRFGMTIHDKQIEDALDTYRDWLHARSLCPRCGQTGVQDRQERYSCLACHQHWTANDARHCGLKRRVLT